MSGHQNGFTEAEKAQIREIVREVVSELKDSGFMAQVRETARHEATVMCQQSCPFKAQIMEWAGKAMVGILVLCTIIGALIFGGMRGAAALWNK